MRKIIFVLFTAFLIPANVFAGDADVIDVFEEYASFDDEECTTYSIELTTDKNTPIGSELMYSGDNVCTAEITVNPHFGRVEIDGKSMSFTYIPNNGFTGEDCFYYRVSDGRISSNVSKCTIKVAKAIETASSEFYYADMIGNQAEYAALKMVEMDILKGERIGKEYYFYPETQVTRGMALSCITRADKQQKNTSSNVKAVFADSDSVAAQVKQDVYNAVNTGIINGVSENGANYLNLNTPVTRAEFICMLDRAMAGKTETNASLSYADAGEIPDYAVVSVKNLLARNILLSNNSLLRPNDPLTKEDMADMLYKFVRYNEQKTVKTMANRIRENLYNSRNT